MTHDVAKIAGEIFLLLLAGWVILFGAGEALAAHRKGFIHTGRAGRVRLYRRNNPRIYWSTILFNGVVLPLLGLAIVVVVVLGGARSSAGGHEFWGEGNQCRGDVCWHEGSR